MRAERSLSITCIQHFIRSARSACYPHLIRPRRRLVLANDPPRVEHARDPPEDPQQNVDQDVGGTSWPSARGHRDGIAERTSLHEDRDGREEDGQEVEQDIGGGFASASRRSRCAEQLTGWWSGHVALFSEVKGNVDQRYKYPPCDI